MKFKTLTLQGFRSFAQRQTFIFPTSPGFYFITGQNEDEPELEGNAAGKSSFFLDGLTWVLFGKTSRKQRAEDVKNWYSDVKVAGELEFEIKGHEYKVIRTWNPNSLQVSVDGSDAEDQIQEDLEELLGLGFDPFLHSVLFGQFREFFFDLGPTEKSLLLSNVLSLTEWDAYSKTATNRSTELQLWLQDQRQELAGVLGKLELLRAKDFTIQINEWEEDRQKKLGGLKEALTTATAELQEVKKEAEGLVQRKIELDGALAEIMTDERELEKIRQDCEHEVSQQRVDLGVFKRKQEELEALREQLCSTSNTVCLECGQKIDAKHVDREVDKVDARLADLYKQQRQAEKKLKTVGDDLQEVREAIKQFKDETTELRVEEAEVRTRISQLKTKSSELLNIQRNGRLSLTELEMATNPYVMEQAKTEQQIKELEYQAKKYEKELVVGEIKLNATQYWGKGFKEVRLHLISDILGQLELEVNNCLFQLGLRDWRIEFAMDKETKKGTIQKGFNVMVYSPRRDKPVSWESWSGGETQRLRLAGALGLSNLILSRSGIEPFVEVYDEPSQFLSESGIASMLEVLHNRAIEQGRQVWLIDHRNLDALQFDGVYTVVKTKEGSRILEESEI